MILHFGIPVASLSLLLGASLAAAQAGVAVDRPAVMAMRVAVAPVIDGRSDDPAWATGPVSSDFRDFAPREGTAPAMRTEVRVRYDDRRLYVLVRAFDPHPDSIVRRVARRDTFDPTADVALIFLDPLHDGRTGYEFDVTASGVKWDAALVDDGNEDFSWDGVWDCATRMRRRSASSWGGGLDGPVSEPPSRSTAERRPASPRRWAFSVVCGTCLESSAPFRTPVHPSILVV